MSATRPKKRRVKKKPASTQLRLVVPRKDSSPKPGPGHSLKVVGLFAGIGGLELGLQRAGHKTRLLCELDPRARAVLDKHFEDVPKHDDVCTLAEIPRGTDLVTAGFPCQDLSQAGMTRGIKGSRSGLVGEVFRLLEHRRAPWVLLENVPFMLQLARGRALEVIVGALEKLGYRWAYRVLDTRAFGLPQRRQRVFLLASLDCDPRDVLFVDEESPIKDQRSHDEVACGFYWTEGVRGLGWAVDSVPTLKGGSTIGIPSPPAMLLPDGGVAKPDIRDAERMQGFPSDWTKVVENASRRGHRWKLVGNAVTVDVAEWIGSRLARPGKYEAIGAGPVLPGKAWPRAAWNIGTGRYTTELSSWPVARTGPSLLEFLKFAPEPLSVKATSGFLGRAATGSLRFPPGFLEAVGAHLKRMQSSVAA
jgi:DNA (cytosine-5)-methyltransferase 1